MSNLAKKLDVLEARFQALIEGRIARLLPAAQISKANLLGSLKAALESGAQQQQNGKFLAPDIFTISTHPQHALQQPENKTLLRELAAFVQQAGMEAGFYFTQLPTVDLIADEKIALENIDITAKISHSGQIEETTAIDLTENKETDHNPTNAFLIVNGNQVFSLETSIVNIGRSAGNHLVIDDARVSRKHAQLRAIRGRYLLFDLDSTGGTYVNSVRIQQSTLQPQDVISLAGVPLVFGQEIPPSVASTQELGDSETHEDATQGTAL